MRIRHPLTFAPILVRKPWGGERLRAYGRDVAAGATVGESWDLADVPPDRTEVAAPSSTVDAGPLAGRTLHELLQEGAADLLGTDVDTPRHFPLLVKLLDAARPLSVQVHPPADLAPDEHKVETWVVLDAARGAHVLLGVADGVGRDEVLDALGTPRLVELLRRVPVTAGDVLHVTAGAIHALGAGVLALEVQTTSDTTYRLWDWEQPGAGRVLHLEQGAEAITAAWDTPAPDQPVATAATTGTLVDAAAYRVERVRATAGGLLLDPTVDRGPAVVVVTAGAATFEQADGSTARIGAGGLALVPHAATGPLHATVAGTEVVVARPRLSG